MPRLLNTRPLSTRPHPTHFRPSTAFAPYFAAVLRNNPKDKDLLKFLNEAELDPEKVLRNYASLGPSATRQRFGKASADAEAYRGSFVELLNTQMRRYATEYCRYELDFKRETAAELRKLRALAPSQVLGMIPTTPAVAAALEKYWYSRLCKCLEHCGCQPPAKNPDPPKAPKYYFRAHAIRCNDQQDSTGDDSAYLVSIAADGNGHVIAQQSQQHRMDEDQLRIIDWPIYPAQDPNGFLDISVRLYEEDGHYEDVGRAIRAIGSTVLTASGGNVYVAIAGAALFVAGSVVEIASFFDNDDDLGTANFTYTSSTDLQTRVGIVNRDFTEDDNADYDVSFELFAIP